MRIPCPHCGERDVQEFSYLGDAGVGRHHGIGAERLHQDHRFVRRLREGEFEEHQVGLLPVQTRKGYDRLGLRDLPTQLFTIGFLAAGGRLVRR